MGFPNRFSQQSEAAISMASGNYYSTNPFLENHNNQSELFARGSILLDHIRRQRLPHIPSTYDPLHPPGVLTEGRMQLVPERRSFTPRNLSTSGTTDLKKHFDYPIQNYEGRFGDSISRRTDVHSSMKKAVLTIDPWQRDQPISSILISPNSNNLYENSRRVYHWMTPQPNKCQSTLRNDIIRSTVNWVLLNIYIGAQLTNEFLGSSSATLSKSIKWYRARIAGAAAGVSAG